MSTLRLRILAPILVLHLLALPIILYKYLNHLQEPVWTAFGQSILQQVQDQIAIHQMSEEPGIASLQKAISETTAFHEFHSLRVYDASGTLRAVRGLEVAHPYPINRVEVRLTKNGYIMEATRWVRNAPECKRCHDSRNGFIGVLEVSVPVTNLVKELGTREKQAVAIIMLILIGVFGLIATFHYVFIVRPVRMISTALERIENGDLAIRIPPLRNDELGIVAARVNDVATALDQARKELEAEHSRRMTRAEQLATVGEIAAGLAHEVKNPLAGISSALEVLISEMSEDASERAVLEQILHETQRITAIFNRLLEYARPKHPHPEWCDASLIVSDVAGIFAPQCQKRRVGFDVRVADDVGKIFVDAQVIKQVLFNILRNSLEAVGAGGSIEFAVESRNRQVHFRITDNGQGMDPETKAKIFQPFFTTKPDGTGLGLAIVYRLVTEMDGKLAVESEPGKGTIFEVQIPREETGNQP